MWLQIPVLIHLRMPDGRLLRQDGFTILINEQWCLVQMETKPERGQPLTLENPKSGIEQSGRVVEAERSREGGYAVAIEFDRVARELWSAVFSPKDRHVGRS
jgi:hypothetical protein